MFEKVIIFILMISAFTSAAASFLSFFKDNEGFMKFGRGTFYTVFIGLVLVSGMFMADILAHNYSVTYIWKYSSNELSLWYLIASFFAGQEGSFLLWALLLAMMGVFVMPYARKHNIEAPVIAIYALILAILLLLLVVKSPFEFLWESFDNVDKGFRPENGKGLNPILENFWVAVHPPVLFIGYAAMSIPYAFALAGFMKKDFTGWVKPALPPTLFASGILGLGIAMGAFWAYETLGWGGFWGWDPVENASLVPWILSVILIHTMIIQKRTKKLVVTNYFLAVLAFAAVLYGTFLTRSGILGDFSVHSFVDPGRIVYTLLLAFILVFLILGIVIYFLNKKHIVNKNKNKISQHDYVLILGSILMFLSASIVFIGMSFPIISSFFSENTSAVDIDVYDRLNLPLVIFMMLLNGLSLKMSKNLNKDLKFLKKLIPAFVIAVLGLIFLNYGKINNIAHIILIFSSFFAIVINLEKLISTMKNNPVGIGGVLSHIGFAFLLLGALASGGYAVTSGIALNENESKMLFDLELTYTGKTRIEEDLKDREKFICDLLINTKDSKEHAKPIFYWSDFNERKSPYMEPGIISGWTQDIYISPRSVELNIDAPSIILKKTEKLPVSTDSTYTIELVGFDMSKAMRSDGDKVLFGAMIEITNTSDGTLVSTDTVYSKVDMSKGLIIPMWYHPEGMEFSIAFSEFVRNSDQMADSGAQFSFNDGNETLMKNVFIAEISKKPFVSLVWAGMLLMVIGFIPSIFNHIQNKTKIEKS